MSLRQVSREVVHLRVGERHAVRLPGLGAAGYRWNPRMEGTEQVADVVRDGVASLPANAGVGTSPAELFTLRALSPGVASVRFVQRRPWEPQDLPSAAEHVVELHVTDR